ncbi:MAG: YidC/Oxa1 family insertase periplasmic-domain containing protein, partial [Planctomycetes bacterium]|nr:YidC/Oxa1 family insertase periplasmic-domain containing protein [Planctomycetota bacterium]
MDKKNLSAIIGLTVFIILWQFVVIPNLPEKYQPLVPPAEEQSEDQDSSSSPADTLNETEPKESSLGPKVENPFKAEEKAVSKIQEVLIPEETITVETDIFRAEFSNLGGALKFLSLHNYHPESDSDEDLVLIDQATIVHGEKTMKHELSENEGLTTLTFSSENFKKTYTISHNSYTFNILIEGADAKDLPLILKPLSELSSVEEGGMARANKGALFSSKSRSYSENSTPHTAETLMDEPIHKE